MIAFQVNDMTCGHCASLITRAVKGADRDAKVHVDIARHRVEIESNGANAQEMSDAIKEAGYTPVAA
ncbi:MAG TPA: heavy-metal-associated domain-containing protein [Burkholderiaceae bacterium]|nr:heavy-metal-associated domain-containing protein [Burkholderiaceae bacterium]